MTQRLYAFSIRHGLDIISAGHVMGRDAADARRQAGARYAHMHAPAFLAELRRADPVHGAKLADLSAGHPPLSACEIVVRPSKAKDPADWIAD